MIRKIDILHECQCRDFARYSGKKTAVLLYLGVNLRMHESPSADEIGQVILAFIVEAIKQEVFTVDAESLRRYAESYDLEVGKFGTTQHRGIFPCSFTRFAAKYLHIPRILTKFAMKILHKQGNSC